MVTPFHADGRVNDDASVAMAKHLLAQRLPRAGRGGHDRRGRDADRRRAGPPGRARRRARPAATAAIVAGAGSNDTRHAIRLTQRVVARGRGRRPLRHAVLQQAEPARDRAPLRGGRARGRGHAGHPLQHPGPHRREHAAGPAGRARADRRDRRPQAGELRRAPADRRPGRPRRQRRHLRAPAWTWAARAASASPRTSSGRRCAACTTSPSSAPRSTRRCATSTRRCSSPPARRR